MLHLPLSDADSKRGGSAIIISAFEIASKHGRLSDVFTSQDDLKKEIFSLKIFKFIDDNDMRETEPESFDETKRTQLSELKRFEKMSQSI